MPKRPLMNERLVRDWTWDLMKDTRESEALTCRRVHESNDVNDLSELYTTRCSLGSSDCLQSKNVFRNLSSELIEWINVAQETISGVSIGNFIWTATLSCAIILATGFNLSTACLAGSICVFQEVTTGPVHNLSRPVEGLRSTYRFHCSCRISLSNKD